MSAAPAFALAFAPAGQSTQMIVGAADATDRVILASSASLYAHERLRRVYYSAFSPIPDAPSGVPTEGPPLLRERRLCQADWLMRAYGFEQRVAPRRFQLELFAAGGVRSAGSSEGMGAIATAGEGRRKQEEGSSASSPLPSSFFPLPPFRRPALA